MAPPARGAVRIRFSPQPDCVHPEEHVVFELARVVPGILREIAKDGVPHLAAEIEIRMGPDVDVVPSTHALVESSHLRGLPPLQDGERDLSSYHVDELAADDGAHHPLHIQRGRRLSLPGVRVRDLVAVELLGRLVPL